MPLQLPTVLPVTWLHQNPHWLVESMEHAPSTQKKPNTAAQLPSQDPMTMQDCSQLNWIVTYVAGPQCPPQLARIPMNPWHIMRDGPHVLEPTSQGASQLATSTDSDDDLVATQQRLQSSTGSGESVTIGRAQHMLKSVRLNVAYPTEFGAPVRSLFLPTGADSAGRPLADRHCCLVVLSSLGLGLFSIDGSLRYELVQLSALDAELRGVFDVSS